MKNEEDSFFVVRRVRISIIAKVCDWRGSGDECQAKAAGKYGKVDLHVTLSTNLEKSKSVDDSLLRE